MKLSLRYKLLALLGSVLAAAVVAHLLLATRLFTRDKLAYIFDLNASLANTLAEEVRSGLESLSDKIAYYAAEHSDAAMQRLLRSEPDLLEIAIAGEHIVDDARLDASNVTRADLAEVTQRYPLDTESVQQLGHWLENVSLPPDLALWRLSSRLPDGKIVSAVLKPDRFLRMFGNAGAFTAYVVDARGGVLLHPMSSKLIERGNLRGLSIVRDALESKTSREVQIFTGEDKQHYIGAYAQVPSFGLAVITETPEQEAHRASAALVKKTTLFAIGIFFIALLVSIFVARALASPLQRLTEAMRDVGRGDYNVNVPIDSGDEVGVLAAAFNRMAQELDDREHRIETAHKELARAEKLATLGVLGAEISHEIKNPLSAIIGFSQLARTTQDMDELREYMATIESQTKRARELLDNFLSFTRQEQAAHEPIDLNTVVLDALKLVKHQLAKHKVEVQTVLSPQPAEVHGNANQLQQVLLNLILNADQAMEGGRRGALLMTTRVEGEKVVLSIKDNGPGMSEEVKKNLFKPFFTTKPKGKGTGLGLSVSHSIVQQHAGEWAVESALGSGTTFTMTFPKVSAQSQRVVA